MAINFFYEAREIINLLPTKEPFTSHQFYTLYAMGYPLSYLEWLRKYNEVHKAHREISKKLKKFSVKLGIERCGNKKDENIFGNEDDIALWKRIQTE